MTETVPPTTESVPEPAADTPATEAPAAETPAENPAPTPEEEEDELEVDLDALPKMKVSELKDILKALDLPTSGIKTALIERIQQHFAEEDKAESAPADTPATEEAAPVEAAKKEEEELLKEEETPAEPAKDFIELEKKEPAKKQLIVPPTADDSKTEEEKKEARAAKFGIVTDKAIEEKKQDRAAKFGIDTPKALEDKKAKRSERFGLAAATTKLSVSSEDKSKDDEKLKKRAARFNISAEAPSAKVIKYDIAEVLKDKIEKTGKTTVDLSPAGLSLEEKKKLRALKFGA